MTLSLYHVVLLQAIISYMCFLFYQQGEELSTGFFTTLKPADFLPETHIIWANPDRPNIFIGKERKPPSTNISTCYDFVIKPICTQLKEEQHNFPVSLLYVPHNASAMGQSSCNKLFAGKVTIDNSLYSALYQNQAEDVKRLTLEQLSGDDPRIRLVLCSISVSLGFDSPSVTQVIHLSPPRILWITSNRLDVQEDVDNSPMLCCTTTTMT